MRRNKFYVMRKVINIGEDWSLGFYFHPRTWRIGVEYTRVPPDGHQFVVGLLCLCVVWSCVWYNRREGAFEALDQKE